MKTTALLVTVFSVVSCANAPDPELPAPVMFGEASHIDSSPAPQYRDFGAVIRDME